MSESTQASQRKRVNASELSLDLSTTCRKLLSTTKPTEVA